MALAVKTIEVPFTTSIATLATNTTLGTATELTFTAVTVALPESSKTIRSAVLRITFRDAAPTTARRLDGVRIGVQIDAVAFDDGSDLTGTGITNTGDHFSAYADRDVTSYFVTNYTGTSHTVGARFRAEEDVADLVNNITCKLVVTYEYDDASTSQAKTVWIPLEGLTGSLVVGANTNVRGSATSGQIPALGTFLPETGKIIDHVWFEVEATDGGAATTDFSCSYATGSGATARAVLEQGLNTSVRFYDIWNVGNTFDTSSAFDFQAWTSLANTFQRFSPTLCVTYRYDATGSSTVINSIKLPLPVSAAPINGTTAADRDSIAREVWIQEPGPIQLVQSGLRIYYAAGGAVNITVSVTGSDAAGGAQGVTTSTYTTTAFVQSGMHQLQHRLDLPHGGTPISMSRGKNTLTLNIFASANVAAYAPGGYYILNYYSSASAQGLGSHNRTTEWQLATTYGGTIAGTTAREITTTNQRTPNIPQSNYFINGAAFQAEYNMSANGGFSLLAEQTGSNDGWRTLDITIYTNDGEFGHATIITAGLDPWMRYPEDAADSSKMNIEGVRKYRTYGSVICQSSIRSVITLHAITASVAGTIAGSAGGVVDLKLIDASTGQFLTSGSRTGNGSYSLTWYDDTMDVYVLAYESSTLKGASKRAPASASNFDITLTSGGEVFF